MISITEAEIKEMMRERVAQVLDRDTLRRLRRSILAEIAAVDAEEAGELLGITPRAFKAWARKVNIQKLPFGHKSPRWRVKDILAAMKARAITPRPRKRTRTL